MLPHPYGRPAGRSKALVGVAVPAHVAFDLLSPPTGIALRARAVLGAPMPEASVDEYRDPCGREQQVSTASHPWENGINAVPETPREKQTADGYLRPCVPLALTDHACQCLRTGRHRSATVTHRYSVRRVASACFLIASLKPSSNRSPLRSILL
jgi:hypothetical protein